MANGYNTAYQTENYFRWKKPNYGYPRYGMDRSGYNIYSISHIANVYTIATISIVDDEEIENEIQVNLCCASHLDISKKKFSRIIDGCIGHKAFIVPKSVIDELSFFAFIKDNAVSLR
jgi:hypothetical protein